METHLNLQPKQQQMLMLALLSMRTRRFFQKTSRKITINGSDTAGYDKSKVNQDNSRRTVNVEEISSKAMLAIDGAGFDWSHMADDEVPTNMALMAFSDSEIEFVRAKQQEKLVRKPVMYAEMYRSQGPRGNQRNWNNQKSQQLGRSQIPDKSRKGLGFVSYNAVLPPSTGLFLPPNLDLSYSSLEEFQQPEFEGYGPKPNKNVSQDTSNEVKESPDAPLAKELVSDDKLEKKTIFPTIAKIEFVRAKQQEKPVRKPVKYAKMYRSQSPRGNQRNWNNQKSQQLGRSSIKRRSRLCYCGCSRHMTGNMSYLSDFKKFDGGYVTFGGGAKGGKITSKENLKTADESQVLLTVPRKNNMYSVDMKNINRVLVVKPHNKTPYELFRGKFDGKSDEGFFIRYSLNSKDFRVYNIRTRKVEENLHIRLLEYKPIIAGNGTKWLFDIDVLTKSMNYVPVVTCTNSNDLVGTEESIGTSHSSKEARSSQDNILMPLRKDGSLFDSSSKNANNDEPHPSSDVEKKDDECVNKESGIDDQERPENNTQDVNTVGPSINTASTNVNTDMSNITTTYPVPSTPNTRIHKDHSLDHVIGDIQSGVLTRRITKTSNEQGFISDVYEGKTHEDLHTCLFACFLSQVEPKKVIQALTDPSWIEAMQDELLQFKLQKVWTLVDLPYGKRAIGTKWVYRNKKDERGIMIRNKARLVAHGYTQEERIDYDEVFASVARIEAIRLFLAYASFKDVVVYQMDVKSAFLYGNLEDLQFLDIVYKVEKALYGLHQAPRAWVKGDILLVQVYVDDIIFGSTRNEMCIEFEKMMHKKFQMSSMGELTFFLRLQVSQKDDGIFINQDKYVDEILKKFSFLTVKTTSTPMETSKPLLKDAEAKDVDVHLYRSMIGSLIIFRYLKGQPKLGLWYPKDPSFDLEAYTDSNYAGASLDRKSTTGGCNFLRKQIDISWQCQSKLLVAKTLLLKAGVMELIQVVVSGAKIPHWGCRRCSNLGCLRTASKQSNDPPLSRVNTLGSVENIMKLKELIDLCTKLPEKVLDLG
ncbi:putative ribonuclease H-like domain-containing protein [Tanacetum coccineum]|uniref:Ribonuclease H-like domain-containing protein n=1 Tax=Tanacetum coccineum TaxID=301880 RepID=A0ABQ4Y3D5_9ASTR